MDFMQASGVEGISGNLKAGQVSYSITSELSDGTDRSSLHSLSQRPEGLHSSASNFLKHCRPGNDEDTSEDITTPFKLSRTDLSAHAEIDPKLRVDMSNGLIRSNTILSDVSLGGSSNSTVSDYGLLACDYRAMDGRPFRNDTVIASRVYNSSGVTRGRLLSVPHHQDYFLNASELSAPMVRDGLRMIHGRGPFTAEQWVELHQQALIFHCITQGFSPPPALLIRLRNTVSVLNRLPAASYNVPSITFNLGSQTSTDPEPGRCRRTDGKKWRCAREVVPEQKYCERHMNRGRNRTRKSTDCQAPTSSQLSGTMQAPSLSTKSAATLSASNASHEMCNAGTIGNCNNTAAMNSCSQQRSSPSSAVKNPPSYTPFPAGITPSSQLQFSFQVSTAAGAGIAKQNLRPPSDVPTHNGGFSREHVFLSSDGTTGKRLYDDAQTLNNLTATEAVNDGVQLLSSDITGASNEGNCVNRIPFSAGSVGCIHVCGESEAQSLRRFFDDWPRSKDSAALSWPDLEDQKISQRVSNTNLSISIPTQIDFPSSNESLVRAKAPPACLKLSGSGTESQRINSDYNRMSLSMGPEESEDAQRPPSWVPVAWDGSMGGPLGEVLHSSTPRGGKSPGLNLLGEYCNSSPQESPRPASPTGVLQKPFFCSCSDSSSGASSPRAMKIEPGPKGEHA